MLLQGCLEGIDIDVVEMTYAELSTEGNRCDVFRKYDIQFIITTSVYDPRRYDTYVK